MKKLDYLAYSYAIICRQYILNDLKKENYTINRQNDEINYISNLLKDTIFDKMIADGGTQTPNGVMYKGFEYRTLFDGETLAEYLDNVLKDLGINTTEQLVSDNKTYLPFYVACNIIYDYEKNGYDNHFNYLGYNSSYTKDKNCKYPNKTLPNKLLSIRNDKNYAKKVLGDKNIYNTLINLSTLEIELIKDKIIEYAPIESNNNLNHLFDEYTLSKEIANKIKEYVENDYRQKGYDNSCRIEIDDIDKEINDILTDKLNILEKYYPVKIHSMYIPVLKDIANQKYYSLDEIEDNILSSIEFDLRITGTIYSKKEPENIDENYKISYNDLGIRLSQEFDKELLDDRVIDQNTYSL